MNIGENIYRIRVLARTSQEELAERAGVTQEMVSQIEKGQKAPSLKLAVELAKALKVSLDELVK